MIWRTPRKIILSSGTAEGFTASNALDKALLDAGVGNLNLIQVTSVVPANAIVLRLKELCSPLEIQAGTLVPAVYTYTTSDVIGNKISATIIAGKPNSQEKNGMIFEKSSLGDLVTTQNIARRMLKESFDRRDLTIADIILEGAEYIVKRRVGCAIAVALMLV